MDALENLFKKEIKKMGYVDFLALPFLSFETLYENRILSKKSDIFVYMDTDEAFLSIYKDGKYISTKGVITINDILEKLQTDGIKIGLNELYDTLISKGLDASLYSSDETELFSALEAIFSDILTKIGNIATRSKSIFGFEKIERFIFSTRRGSINGLKEFIHNFGFPSVECLI